MGDGVLDVGALRSSTPGVAAVVHLNSAGMALPSAGVLERVRRHLDEEARGGYEAALAAAGELDAVRARVAGVVGCHPSEVALTISASEAVQLALAAVPWRPGDRIVTTAGEYATQALTFRLLEGRCGVEVRITRNTPEGALDLDDLERHLAGGARLVSVCHVPAHTGVVAPLRAVADRAHAAGALVLVDAAQSLGQVPVDAAAADVDLLVATGRKFLRAPRGTGLLVVRGRATALEPATISAAGAVLDLSSGSWRWCDGAVRFERWETSVAARLGLGVACAELLRLGPAPLAARIAVLASLARRLIHATAGLRLADPPAATAGIVGVQVDGVAAEHAVAAARRAGIQLWVVDPGQVPFARIPATIRLSPHAYTLESEIERAVGFLSDLARSPTKDPGGHVDGGQ
jgi:selenocysteine lyase/cysteine desulfurase